MEPCKADSPGEKEKLHVHYRKVIAKVQEVIEDEEIIEKIMKQYDKQNETKEEYIANREARIKKLCQLADVSYEEYIKAIEKELKEAEEERTKWRKRRTFPSLFFNRKTTLHWKMAKY